MNKFWRVGVKNPYTIYAEEYTRIEDAESEAERLAYEYGYTAFVLEAVSFFERSKPLVEKHEFCQLSTDESDENKRLRIEIALLRGTISQMEEASQKHEVRRAFDVWKELENNRWKPCVSCAQPNISVMFGIDG